MALRRHDPADRSDFPRNGGPASAEGAGLLGAAQGAEASFWPRAPLSLALEPRIMFDAAGAATYADAADDGETDEAVTPDDIAPKEIVFVDSGIADKQALIDGIGNAAEIHILDGDSPALGQIADHLDGRTDIGAVHILSHGANGALKFASGVVDSGNLADFADDLARIGVAIADGGDILLYGCFVAADGAGQAFVDAIAGKTGADIAASIDPTGADESGGDWVLEHATGPIGESDVTALLAASDFGGVLVSPVFGTMDFGTDETVLGLGEDIAVAAADFPELNGFNISGAFWELTGLGSGPPDGAEFSPVSRAIALLTMDDEAPTQLSGPDNAALVWMGGLDGAFGIENARMDSADNSEFRLSSIDLEFFQLSSFYTYNWIEIVGVNNGVETGTARFTNLVDGNAMSIDFSSPTTGSFDSITGLFFRSDSTLTISGDEYTGISYFHGSIAIDNMVIAEADTNTPPEIGGVSSVQAVDDNATVAPLSGVNIADADGDNVTVTIALDNAAKGTFTAASLTASGFVDAGGGTYTLSERSAAAATTAIQALVFEPTENRVAPGTTETTTFTITVNDGTTDTINDTTTVVSTSINDAPAIGGFAAGQAVNDNATISPFAAATISDPDVGQTFTVTITLDDADKGVLTNLGDFSHQGGGVYQATGLANAAAAETALRALVFDPASNRVAPGATETTTFTVAVSDGVATVDNATTTVIATSINDVPTATNMTQVVTYTEDPADPVALGNIVVTDPDVGETITATLTLNTPAAGALSTGTFGAATSTYDAATGIWTVSGSVADVNAALAAVAFTPVANWDQDVTITTRIRDAADTGPADGTITLDVTAVNDAPVFSNLTSSATFVEGGTPVQIAPGVSIADIELDARNGGAGNYAGASLTIMRDGGLNALDRLSVATGGSLTVAGSPAGGGTISAGGNIIATIADTGNGQLQLTFENNGTIPTTALVNETLRAVHYANASDDPPATISLRWTFSDGNDDASQGTGGVETVTGTTDIAITPVNDPPTLTATPNDPEFIEGGVVANLFSGSIVSTIEAGQTITSLRLTVSNLVDGADEKIIINGTAFSLTDGTTGTEIGGDITISVAGNTATVDITNISEGTPGAQSLIDGLAYRNDSNNPGTADPRVVTLTQITDSGGTANGGEDTASLAIASSVSITAVNDPPIITGVAGQSSGVVAGTGPAAIGLFADATVSDVDTTVFDGGFVQITQNTGTANGNFGLDGTSATSGGNGQFAQGEAVAVGGTVIGTVAAGQAGQDGDVLRIDLNADATPARVEALLRALTYEAPSGLGERGFTLAVDDGGADGGPNGDQSTATASFTIEATPNPPVIAGFAGAIDYTEDTGLVRLNTGLDAVVTDADSANFDGGELRLSITANNVTAEDRLAIIEETGVITLDGANVLVAGTVIGTFTGGTSGNDLVVSFNNEATPTAVTTLVRALGYENLDTGAPTETTRTITLTIRDAAAGPGAATSEAASIAVTIIGVNDAPELGSIAPGPQATDDKSTITPFSGATVVDVDGPTVPLTVTVSLDDAAKGSLTNLGGFVDQGDGSYVFNGNQADAQAALRGLVFTPTENRVAPGATETTTLTVLVNDGEASDQAQTQIVTTSVNDAATLTGIAATLAQNDNVTSTPFSGAVIANPDVDQPLTLRVTIDEPARGSFTAASLTASGFTDMGGGVYERTAPDAATAQAALRTLVFVPVENRLTPGDTEDVVITARVDDGIAAATEQSTTVTVTSVNDPPAIAGFSDATVAQSGTIVLFADVTIADPDPGQVLSIVIGGDKLGMGTFTAESLTDAGFTGTGFSVYNRSGIASAAEAQEAIRKLVFVPEPDRLAAGESDTQIFDIFVSDGTVTSSASVTLTIEGPPLAAEAPPPVPATTQVASPPAATPPAPPVPPAIAPPPPQAPIMFTPIAPPPVAAPVSPAPFTASPSEPAMETAGSATNVLRSIVPGFFVAPDTGALPGGEAIRAETPIIPVTGAVGAGAFTITLPASTFVVADASLPVSVTAALADGSDLPEWLSFNAETGSLEAEPPEGAEGVYEIVITATLPGGESAEATLSLTIEAEEAETEDAMLRDPAITLAAGKPAFSEVVRAASRVGMATHAGAFDMSDAEFWAEPLPEAAHSDDMTFDYNDSMESA
jgi:plastocyanin